MDFYRQYNPAKLGEVDSLRNSFRGREAEMFGALYNKYSSRTVLLTPRGVAGEERAQRIYLDASRSFLHM